MKRIVFALALIAAPAVAQAPDPAREAMGQEVLACLQSKIELRVVSAGEIEKLKARIAELEKAAAPPK